LIYVKVDVLLLTYTNPKKINISVKDVVSPCDHSQVIHVSVNDTSSHDPS